MKNYKGARGKKCREHEKKYGGSRENGQKLEGSREPGPPPPFESLRPGFRKSAGKLRCAKRFPTDLAGDAVFCVEGKNAVWTVCSKTVSPAPS